MKEERLKRKTDELEFVHIKSYDMLRITKKERFLLCLFFSDRIMFVFNYCSNIGVVGMHTNGLRYKHVTDFVALHYQNTTKLDASLKVK